MNNQWILYGLTCPLAYVVFSDLFYRKIYNHLIVFLLMMVLANVMLFFVDMGSYAGMNPEQAGVQLGLSLAGAAGVLMVGMGLFLIDQMGAGDVKLMAVLCLLVGGDNQVAFLLLTALAGGCLVFMMPLVRLIEVKGARHILQIAMSFPSLNIPVPDSAYTKPAAAGLPYGIAISVGAVLSLMTPFTH
ncbi:Type IV leader peptidase family protein [Vibrio aerogenes CECT 7868]|uniref:Type IV leader peptidase family protein n=1 Tax=Vibrio aerogenes CECT 7868 TaxID=1216006 RepID=A0A1M5ZSF4_9VIBR|nr:prepilin peptidase [Vibrio aerogenes]SHI27227.1 Type IV leader peptidase family protein [Vibrio aerogenes CECT 7868]